MTLTTTYTDIAECLGAYRIGPGCDYAEPPFEELAVLADALYEAGEYRLQDVVLWMMREERWPVRYARFWWNATTQGEKHSQLPDELVRHIKEDGTLGLCVGRATFLDAIHALSVALHLQSFEGDPTPNHAAARECADWLEQHERRPDLVRGIRQLCADERWPTKWEDTVAHGPWAIACFTRLGIDFPFWHQTWAGGVETIGKSLAVTDNRI